ncbi:uncharacterized protein LOC111706154 isoform X2 [Eurytemora carolleeae]|uniref:uncharacterized protein LOC111706154 isoform X2 n=1 Tax=Eurytemora carolleeae TaxID=1294199 RepID=UPI000C790D2C|nr:uncharacterized protein LOC111706154 isoform X2 [Eurytemora carolleeae]|eukprot:XP_023334708.1 uncharacterized protein LOC111706154 isoform X2 [Eurytemora affinis]
MLDESLEKDEINTSKSVQGSRLEAQPKKNKKERKKKNKQEKKPILPEKGWPNVFLAFQIRNPEIHKKLINIQYSAVNKNKNLMIGYESMKKAHVTLFVAYVEEDKMEQFKGILEEYFNGNLKNRFTEEPFTISFQGLGHFKDKVVFGQPVTGVETIQRIAEELKDYLIKARIDVKKDDHPVNPHLTIFKCKKHLRNIPLELFEEYKDLDLGEGSITSLQLLSFRKPKDEFGYFHREDEYFFNTESWGSCSPSGPHTECCENEEMTKFFQNSKIEALEKMPFNHEIRLSNVPVNTKKSDLENMLKSFGKISDIRLDEDASTVYVNYCNESDTAAAITRIDGYEYNHCILKAELVYRGDRIKYKEKQAFSTDFQNVKTKAKRGKKLKKVNNTLQHTSAIGLSNNSTLEKTGAIESLNTSTGDQTSAVESSNQSRVNQTSAIGLSDNNTKDSTHAIGTTSNHTDEDTSAV